MSLLESYTLRSAEHSVQVAVQALVDLSKMDPDTFCGKFEENACVLSVDDSRFVRALVFLVSLCRSVSCVTLVFCFSVVQRMFSVPELAYRVSEFST